MDYYNNIAVSKEIENDRCIIKQTEVELETGIYYKGKGKITNGRFTVINLPNNVNNTNYNFRIEVLPIYISNKSNYVYLDNKNNPNPNDCCLYPSELRNNSFIVYGPNIDFYWVARGMIRSIQDVTNNKK